MFRLNDSHRPHQPKWLEPVFFVRKKRLHITFSVLSLKGEKRIAGQAIGPGAGYFDNPRVLSHSNRVGDIQAEWRLPENAEETVIQGHLGHLLHRT